jgi:hypothetical protein
MGECWKRPCAGDKLVTVQADGLALDLLVTPSSEPPSVAFALTMRAPLDHCPLTPGSGVLDDEDVISAHIYCGDILLALTVIADR